MESVQSYLRHSVEDVFAELLVFAGDEHRGASEVWKGGDCASDALRIVLFFTRDPDRSASEVWKGCVCSDAAILNMLAGIGDSYRAFLEVVEC